MTESSRHPPACQISSETYAALGLPPPSPASQVMTLGGVGEEKDFRVAEKPEQNRQSCDEGGSYIKIKVGLIYKLNKYIEIRNKKK